MWINTDESGRITEASAEAVEGWQEIDAEESVFLPDGLTTRGTFAICNFELTDGVITRRADADIEADIAAKTPPEPAQTEAERIAALEADNAELRAAIEALIGGAE